MTLVLYFPLLQGVGPKYFLLFLGRNMVGRSWWQIGD